MEPGSCGLTPGFPRLSPTTGQVPHVLLTRPPLSPLLLPKKKDERPSDLHVLGAPPAFVLSQDQTLRDRPARQSRTLLELKELIDVLEH
jgi:hypothetical protein